MMIVKESKNNVLELALDFLRAKKAIIFATDTVYGMAVDASDSEAIDNLYKLKNRDLQKPIAIFLPDLEVAKKIFSFDKKSLKIAEKFLPGPLTLVLKTQDRAALNLASNLNINNNFLGFRIVDKKFINNLFDKFDGILAVTSANISGKKTASSIAEITEYFDKKDILIIEGEENQLNIESTVVRIYDGEIEILRQGIITKEMLSDL